MEYRKFKFRIWNNKTKSWIHGPNEEVSLFGEMILMGHFLDGISLEDLNEINALQFTGLKDKRNLDIYEGDILRICTNDTPEDPEWELYCVIYKNGCFQLNGKYFNPIYDFQLEGKIDGEVIGNIFENSDLLK